MLAASQPSPLSGAFYFTYMESSSYIFLQLPLFFSTKSHVSAIFPCQYIQIYHRLTEFLKFSRWSRVIKVVITRVLYLLESYISHVQTSYHNIVNSPDRCPAATPRTLPVTKPGLGAPSLLRCPARLQAPGPGAGTRPSREGSEAGRALTAAAFTPVASEPIGRAKATENAVAHPRPRGSGFGHSDHAGLAVFSFEKLKRYLVSHSASSFITFSIFFVP